MTMALQIEELNDTNCKTYLLTVGDEAALIDPVRERLDTYRSLLGRRGLALRMVLETHMHADHLMFNRQAKDLLGATIVMHRASPSPLVDRHIDDGDVLTLGSERIEVLHTPGHTPDSVCYRVAGAVLTGDTLLVGGSGRTDFPGADAGQQYDAVHERLFTLPADTVVWPGHDYHGKTSTTIGQEKRTNPRYVGRSRAEYVTLMGSLGLPFPEKIQQSLQVNQSGFESEEVHFPVVADIAASSRVRSRPQPGRRHAGVERPPPPRRALVAQRAEPSRSAVRTKGCRPGGELLGVGEGERRRRYFGPRL
jgi:sulfur dioxygenase